MTELAIQQYQDSVSGILSARQIETLQILYYLPNSSATAKELANALNYSGYQAANRQVGQIGKSISSYTGIIPPVYDGVRGLQPAYYLLIGEYERPAGWVMWENLKKALENLKLVTSDWDDSEAFERLPTESFQFDENKLYEEGKVIQIFTNRYERNQKARLECIKHYGTKCKVCEFDFGEIYGDIAKGFIHVHHKIGLAEINDKYNIDPINDLIPVCANCHSVIHLTKPAMTIEQLQKQMGKNSRKKLH